MKITKVTPWIVSFPWEMRVGVEQEKVVNDRNLVLVQVDTDEGITGWGEITTYPGPVANRAVAAMVGQVSEFLEGESTNHFERLWSKIFHSFTYVGSRGQRSWGTSLQMVQVHIYIVLTLLAIVSYCIDDCGYQNWFDVHTV